MGRILIGTTKGLQGDPGLVGAQGPRGENGAMTYFGTSAPTDTENKNDNDRYFDTTTGNVYWFGNGQWNNIANIKGLQGDKGPNGATGPQGNKGAAGAAGVKGPAGAKGAKGPNGANGTIPTIVNNLTTTTKNTYSLSANQGKILTDKLNTANVAFSTPAEIRVAAGGNASNYTSVWYAKSGTVVIMAMCKGTKDFSSTVHDVTYGIGLNRTGITLPSGFRPGYPVGGDWFAIENSTPHDGIFGIETSGDVNAGDIYSSTAYNNYVCPTTVIFTIA